MTIAHTAKNLLDDYITKRYDKWLEYATYHCNVSRLQIKPEEVLNEVLCALLERDTAAINALLNAKRNGVTELDYMIFHIIKVNIHRPHSALRYRKGQHLTQSIDENPIPITTNITHDEYFDIPSHYDIVRAILANLNVTEKSKRIFSWRFFEDRSYQEWPGGESIKRLNNTYNRVLIKISREAKRKRHSNSI